MTDDPAQGSGKESDSSLLQRISELIDQEHRLRQEMQGADPQTRAADREQLAQAEIALDQCWDLLRQRQARRTRGENPDDASVRPVAEVENYLQ
jgi:uncharacterized protein DUF2630